jgi:DNA-binding response OmpR family regulator
MSDKDAPEKNIRFSAFRLDLRRGVLFGPKGELNLRPKSFEVLCYLAQNRGRLVSRDELLTTVWGKTVVTEDSLTQCMVDIRRTLGSDGGKFVRAWSSIQCRLSYVSTSAKRFRAWPNSRKAAGSYFRPALLTE